MDDKSDIVYLKHILDAIHRIEEYTQNLNHKQFLSNHLVQDAVIRQIEIIGEATKHLSRFIRKKYPEILWQDIAGMRDKLIHGYFGVDLYAVWNTVKKDIPELKIQIQNIIAEEEQ